MGQFFSHPYNHPHVLQRRFHHIQLHVHLPFPSGNFLLGEVFHWRNTIAINQWVDHLYKYLFVRSFHLRNNIAMDLISILLYILQLLAMLHRDNTVSKDLFFCPNYLFFLHQCEHHHHIKLPRFPHLVHHIP